MKKNNKSNSFTKHLKSFLFISSCAIILISTCIIIGLTPQKIAHGEGISNYVVNFFSQNINNNIPVISPTPAKIFSLDLYKDNRVYVMSKEGAPCNDYKNTMFTRTFAFRCKTLRAIYRGLWTKEIDVTGYSHMQINANLKVNNYTKKYFSDCNYNGVTDDNSLDLIALSKDPNPKLSEECNHVVGEDRWQHCSITNADDSAITHCGLPQCTTSKNCEMNIDVTGKKSIYLLFSVADNWFADVEGALSNVDIRLTK